MFYFNVVKSFPIVTFKNYFILASLLFQMNLGLTHFLNATRILIGDALNLWIYFRRYNNFTRFPS